MLYFPEILSLLIVGLELSTKHMKVVAEVPVHVESLLYTNCSTIEERYFPFIKVQHGDEIYNSSFDVSEATDVVNEHAGFQFSITCVSNYPIEWIVNYFYNGYQNGKNFGLHLQISRKFSNFNDPSTYKFIISSKMRYRNPHGFKNFSFSCRSIHRPSCLQTMLYTTKSLIEDEHGGNGVTVNLVSQASWGNASFSEVPREELGSSGINDQGLPCDFKVFEKNVGFNLFRLHCEFEDGTQGKVKVIHQCLNAIACMSFHQHHHQPLLSEKCVQSLSRNSSCATCHERTIRLSQGFLACVSEEHHPHNSEDKLLFFFSSVPQESQAYSSTLYFNMDHVTTSEMISLARINKNVSLGDQITIVCNTSSYYFATGTKLAIKHKGSNVLSFLKGTLVSHSGSGSDNSPANVYEANIPITTDSIERIYCFAPTWNSFSWVNKSYPINVQVAVITTEEKSSSPHIVVAVSVTLLATTLFFCLLFGICWVKILRRKLSKFGKLLTAQEIDEFRRRPVFCDTGTGKDEYDYINSGLINAHNDISYLEIKRELLLLDETVILGKGHFGKVFKGVFKDEKTGEKMDVAVKTLKTKTDVGALKSLLSELKIMATVGKNLNVVNLVGACTKRMEKGEVYVAVEYCPNGNMQNYLRTSRDKFKNQLQRDILIVETPYCIRKSVSDDTFCSLDLIKWSWEIAKGMEFLSSKKVIHGDLATRNILLTADNVAKVSDFGLSRQLVDYYYVKEESDVAMPWKWMSIESLRDMKFSVQSDVWSCGVTLWELFTMADVPYYGCSWSVDFVQALDSGHRLGKPPYATSEMYDLMRACWKDDPSERPSFFFIKMFFEDIITQCTYQDYMQLDLLECTESQDQQNDGSTRTPLLPPTPTIEIISDCEADDDVFEK